MKRNNPIKTAARNCRRTERREKLQREKAKCRHEKLSKQ
jgi:hypothetical protein